MPDCAATIRAMSGRTSNRPSPVSWQPDTHEPLLKLRPKKPEDELSPTRKVHGWPIVGLTVGCSVLKTIYGDRERANVIIGMD